MPKELRELLAKIQNKKAAARELLAQKKLEEAEQLTNEIKDLQKEFDIASALYEEEANNIPNDPIPQPAANTVKPTDAFVNAMKAAVGKHKLSEDEKEILNATTMTEGIPADGGLTVPKDIRTAIKELRRNGPEALENYVNVESVSTLTGSRVIEVEADYIPFDNVDEAADFPLMEAPKFEDIQYAVKKKGGILKFSKELLADTAENIQGYIKKWTSKKSKATRNALILKAIADNFSTTKVPVKTVDDLKDIFNVKLDPAFETTSKALMNQDAFNFLDKLKDSDGKYILQPNPTMPTQKLLFGKYPIIVVSNKTLKTDAVKKTAPLYFGDFKEAITIFDREALYIEFSEEALDLWGKDLVGMKVRERLDVKPVDKKAIVAGEITFA
ncbi:MULTISPECIES: phage major capsid protein [Bacillus cereus group]|uniref:Phage major capsid protein n=6 Tax=Bacillus cereus group TaxID=86661 RepID=A0AB73UJL0_BACCE|nr:MULTISPECIES: phage major capsid protein [Bacillus cereus group]EKS8364082.1 phage major capsid protein [Bacillus cereus]MBG9484875.1 capsid protein [Bacillus thuringiensis]MBG9511876.1 capsid protein [Bacillus thuringiensis]MEC2869307.1 phage major capsid protein [Bacillus cereus]OTZ65777.1 phage major capsid protein [Bacillus thuringiensis serovar kumamtoensis]